MNITRLLGTVVLGAAIAGCNRAPAGPPPGQGMPPTPVVLATAHAAPIEDASEYVASLKSLRSTTVQPQIDGQITKILVVAGDRVRQGAPLMEIDARRQQAAVSSQQAELAAAEAALNFARQQQQRNNELYAAGAISKQQLEQTDTAQRTADANLKALQAHVQQQEVQLRFFTITAPTSGVVGDVPVRVGNQVTTQTLLTTIVSVDPVYVYFDVDENTVLRVRQLIREGKARSARDPGVKLPVLLSLENEEGFHHQGMIDFVDNQINPKTGTLRVRGVFAQKDDVLSPGLFVRVRVPIGEPHQALLVTERAIDTDQGQKILYVVNEKNEVATRPIRTGDVHDGQRVIKDGIKPDERVIVSGLQNVRPGMKVEPKLVEMPGQRVQDSEFAVQKDMAGPRHER
jgi:RND family efflux transporter MFP subunit